ncbi:MAG: hypothetical protein A2528_03320 [Candidatus Staskawiczbacteria bacterium RIFOXYD2_FULL_37_9]|uniref:Cell filamentation protein Fic n=1 Tax=Candidatus Staskawiczbacteria bacterium RIFOXYB1_FULL_37_44 TaxID=1802223 RepID=A0A1G2IU85_9BACT|nr:MAG: hypothetical protein A2358_02085 [Candidatus Staskawiczbacteria bacterium RIFOXYB1_FULL_37_44]OGZ83170.1 MAG: hypothetical protein A2416_01870 [Candidatus Staskawiczbacteria bacterium RIFOXYC1_FULL_37_52]OGZ94051.1 MAG: hypothetical protein A2528_03320 [Candidatus Staskawiczbacteria bacterium RIFOXYD2_FULL_37_9]
MKKIPDNQISFYQSPDGSVNIEVLFAEENIWLTQKKMAELFDCSTDNISLHLKSIFKESELNQNLVTEEYSATADDGKNYKTKFYSLEAIIAVGYRVNSERGAQFRQWATGILKSYFHKGYAELQAAKGRAMTMKNWTEKLNAFLKFSEYEILTNAGKISYEVAEALALKEYEKYRIVQDKNYISDFDREIKKVLDTKKKKRKDKKQI